MGGGAGKSAGQKNPNNKLTVKKEQVLVSQKMEEYGDASSTRLAERLQNAFLIGCYPKELGSEEQLAILSSVVEAGPRKTLDDSSLHPPVTNKTIERYLITEFWWCAPQMLNILSILRRF